MENKSIGEIVIWKSKRWVVDNSDEDFKDDGYETSLFLLPEEYADNDKLDSLYKFGNPDLVGFWVYESEVEVNIGKFKNFLKKC